MTIETIEPLRDLRDLKKGILVPEKDFEHFLKKFDWTWHQVARNEYPFPFKALDQFQMFCICSDPVLWCRMFLREPEDPDHKDPYDFWGYQKESIRYFGHTIHKCGSEVGKTREIVAKELWKAYTVDNGSGLNGAPQQTHLDEIIEAMLEQIEVYNPDILKKSFIRHKKHPHHMFYFSNGFKIYFRPCGHDGEAFRAVHVKTFAIMDEAAKAKNPKQWSEFWRAMKPSCIAGIYSVPDGDRSCDFYKLAQRAKGNTKEEVEIVSFKNLSAHIKNIKFRLFQWSKTLMPDPYWSEERRRFYIDQYGGEDSPLYKHNVLGEDGDPENTVFPWHRFKHCIKEIPEYRALKILVDSGNNEVIATGYKYEYVPGNDGPVPRQIILMDTAFRASTFFDLDEAGESEFRRLIKSFFVSVVGFKRGGADFGYSGDPTEIIVKSILGKKERVVARLQLKHVTYDQQCQALDAMDDIYGPQENIFWGTDFGNAGSAVAHDLQGLPNYDHKNYDVRLKGFMFESTTENIDEEGNQIIDAKTEKPAKITLKELATENVLVKKMQRLDLEYPPDEDFIVYYPNHTSRMGKHLIYKKEDDHIIDADRGQTLAGLLGTGQEDLFAVGN